MDGILTEEMMLKILEKKPSTKDELNFWRTKIASQYKTNQAATRLLLVAYQSLLKKKRIKRNKDFEKLLTKADIRSTSGISVITTLLKPYTCPGKCIYCPTEVRMPKSYVASEPAAARSLALNFNPYKLMQMRIQMLERNGHSTDKIEYITKGGTWNAYPLKYQYWFILESFKACNNFSRRTQIPETEEKDWNDRPLEELQKALDLEIKYNERCAHRIIGLTLETRPDAISPKTIYHMRRQGCTRVELGLQAPDDKILELIKRGHTVEQFRKAIYLLRQAGFKVDLHFMPDLPGTTPEHDVQMYKLLFSDPGLRPDMVKIYPNAVIPSAELYQWFLDGRFKPYGEEALFKSLLEMKLATPRYCRISRLIRDIPANEIEGGNKITNLREMLETELKKRGEHCVCLRCREISRQKDKLPVDTEAMLFVDEYDTIGGKEYFITFEDPKRVAVFGFLRLRIPDRANKVDAIQKQFDSYLPELKDCAFVRELHVYGTLVGIGKRNIDATQHKGFGKRLMAEAEKIAAENGYQKVAVISGVGVRGYYRKLGYKLRGTYMIKSYE